MDVAAFLQSIEHHRQYAGQISHVQQIPERSGQFAEPRQPLHPALAELLSSQGIEQLYQHQVSRWKLRGRVKIWWS